MNNSNVAAGAIMAFATVVSFTNLYFAYKRNKAAKAKTKALQAEVAALEAALEAVQAK